MSTRELFDFVVDSSLAEDQIDDYLEKVLSHNSMLTLLNLLVIVILPKILDV